MNTNIWEKQVCVHIVMYGDNCPHSADAAVTIDRYLLPAGPAAANLQWRVCSMQVVPGNACESAGVAVTGVKFT